MNIARDVTPMVNGGPPTNERECANAGMTSSRDGPAREYFAVRAPEGAVQLLVAARSRMPLKGGIDFFGRARAARKGNRQSDAAIKRVDASLPRGIVANAPEEIGDGRTRKARGGGGAAAKIVEALVERIKHRGIADIESIARRQSESFPWAGASGVRQATRRYARFRKSCHRHDTLHLPRSDAACG